MTYREVPMYIVACDQCQTEYEDDEYAGWADKQTADEVAERDDWTATKGRHLCPDCAALVVEDPADLIKERHGEPGPNDDPLPLDGAS